MTHTLHRRGDIKSLKSDFVILATPAIGINDVGSGEKLKQILKIAKKHGISNIGNLVDGSLYSGMNFEQIEQKLKDGGRVRGVFSDRGKLNGFLKEVAKADFGLSITVSGLIDDISELSKEIGLTPHTINLSLGIWGRRDLLPKERILEFTTMCGHSLISTNLVKRCLEDIEKGKISEEAAIRKMAKTCVCGIFNPVRAKYLIEKAKSRKCSAD